MRRFAVLLSVVVVMLVGVVAFGIRPVVMAQEATPAAEDELIPEGITFDEILGYGVAETLPAAPAEIALFRIGFEPGATFPFDPGDPSVALAFVESGAITFTVASPITVLRAAGEGEAFPRETEDMPAGTEFTLHTGDSAVLPPHVEGEARNDGGDVALVLVANIGPLTGPGEADQAATPAP